MLSWAGWDDPDSGLREIQWGIGTSNVGKQLTAITGKWLSATVSTHADGSTVKQSVFSGSGTVFHYKLSLSGLLFVSLKLWNHVGLNTILSTKGVLVDSTRPIVGKVFLYNKEAPTHVCKHAAGGMMGSHFQQSNQIIQARWKEFQDSESHIYKFMLYLCFDFIQTKVGFDGIINAFLFNCTKPVKPVEYKPKRKRN